MEREELEKRQALEEGDQEIARKLQVSMMHSENKLALDMKLYILVHMRFELFSGNEDLDCSHLSYDCVRNLIGGT